MSSELNKLASDFLRSYLSEHPAVEFHKTVCHTKKYDIHVLPAEKAEAFMKVLKQSGFECCVLPVPEPKLGSL